MSSRGWTVFSLVGVALMIGATVAAAVIADDPSDPKPVLLTFAASAALFFGAMFGIALWQTRPRPNPELDELLNELAVVSDTPTGLDSDLAVVSDTPTGLDSDLSEWESRLQAEALVSSRRTARAYLVLGLIVTGLGIAMIVESAYDVDVKYTLYALIGIVVVWAAAVPTVLRGAQANSRAVLAPLGLAQSGSHLEGERSGRTIRITFSAKGTRVKVASGQRFDPLDEPAALTALAGRGDDGTWEGVEAKSDGEWISVERAGHEGASWLWDLWLAERLAGG
jgi:hypothetical protein